MLQTYAASSRVGDWLRYLKLLHYGLDVSWHLVNFSLEIACCRMTGEINYDFDSPWQLLEMQQEDPDEDLDFRALKNGYVSALRQLLQLWVHAF